MCSPCSASTVCIQLLHNDFSSEGPRLQILKEPLDRRFERPLLASLNLRVALQSNA